MTGTVRWLLLACTLALAPGSRADVVADWNRIALHTVIQSGQPLEDQLRAMAIVHMAMFEAMNFIEGRYDSRLIVKSPRLHGVSIQTAAAAAAHHVLVELYPKQSQALDAARRVSWDDVLSPEAAAGVITGKSIASVVWASGIHARFTGSERELGDMGFALLTSPLSWNPMIAELIAMRGLLPLDGARLHALAAAVIADSYARARVAGQPCAVCVARAAVATILQSELSTGGNTSKIVNAEQSLGHAIGRRAVRQYFRPTADRYDGTSAGP